MVWSASDCIGWLFAFWDFVEVVIHEICSGRRWIWCQLFFVPGDNSRHNTNDCGCVVNKNFVVSWIAMCMPEAEIAIINDFSMISFGIDRGSWDLDS